ncbi:thioredoxin family protein [Geodermatophilus sabuli]|uniref:Thioredoxin family protein n=1 Tax=Geodermatophilus sabuli TaxID=1564158 RepID=A0A7K3W6I0_9ACTN|nr:thioredoxin family protein [Geodermatophilus sabuli]NEK59437.1 thioredoxin family protein [Geodermatophilus sabuli]
MSAVSLSERDFAATVAGDGIVLVDFRAPWCGPSRRFGPVLEAAARRHPDVRLAAVDIEAERDLARAVGVRAVPTLLVYRDGVLVFAEPGALAADSLDLLIATIRDLDMRAVREQYPAG